MPVAPPHGLVQLLYRARGRLKEVLKGGRLGERKWRGGSGLQWHEIRLPRGRRCSRNRLATLHQPPESRCRGELRRRLRLIHRWNRAIKVGLRWWSKDGRRLAAERRDGLVAGPAAGLRVAVAGAWWIEAGRSECRGETEAARGSR